MDDIGGGGEYVEDKVALKKTIEGPSVVSARSLLKHATLDG